MNVFYFLMTLHFERKIALAKKKIELFALFYSEYSPINFSNLPAQGLYLCKAKSNPVVCFGEIYAYNYQFNSVKSNRLQQ